MTIPSDVQWSEPFYDFEDDRWYTSKEWDDSEGKHIYMVSISPLKDALERVEDRSLHPVIIRAMEMM